MLLNILNGFFQNLRIIFEKPNTSIAKVAQKFSDFSRFMGMIYLKKSCSRLICELRAIAANIAQLILRFYHCFIFSHGQAVSFFKAFSFPRFGTFLRIVFSPKIIASFVAFFASIKLFVDVSFMVEKHIKRLFNEAFFASFHTQDLIKRSHLCKGDLF